jgi:hypothetical protein
MDAIIELDRRLSRALEVGRGIRLSGAELDLLAATGAYAVIHEAAERELKERAQSRRNQRAGASINVHPASAIGKLNAAETKSTRRLPEI